MLFKDKKKRAEYMRNYLRKKKLEKDQITLREKSRIQDLNFKKLSGKITQDELRELQRLEKKHYPKETDIEPVDVWGDLFLTEEDKALNEEPVNEPEPSPVRDSDEFLSGLRHDRDSEKTVYIDLNGEPIIKKKSPDHWCLFDWVE